ncbi:hypothetical protein FDK38_005010 [Candidozyma auris]|nr:hypothetical protein FDK38_005010 [[Candida] auris]
MSAPLMMIINLLRDPEVSNKVILQFAFRQIKAIGYLKVLSLLLGATMVGVSSVIKIPQIRKILKPKTMLARSKLAKGLSEESVSLETAAQWIHVTYNKQQRNSFVNYGESFLLGIQNIAILLILKYYKLRRELAAATTLSEKDQIRECFKALVKPAAAIVAVLVFLTKVCPPRLIATLQILNIPIGILAKIPQIRKNQALKSTAHLSEVTIFANVIGSFIRVFTTVTNFKKGRSRDSVLLAGYSASLALNAVLAGQIIHYGKKDEEKKNE